MHTDIFLQLYTDKLKWCCHVGNQQTDPVTIFKCEYVHQDNSRQYELALTGTCMFSNCPLRTCDLMGLSKLKYIPLRYKTENRFKLEKIKQS